MTEQSALEQLRAWRAETAIVLGSGLNSLVRIVEADRLIPYARCKEIPSPSVPGHTGQFVLDELNGQPVIYAQGRVHLYEGRSAKDVTATVRVLAAAGIQRLVLTNAAGTANEKFPPGSWMMINDHINLTGTTPLLGEAKFVDLSEVYSKGLRDRFQQAAKENRMVLHEGVYAGLLGPQYETPAEVRMLRSLGADAIGMSTVLEAIQARALDLEVAGFSCLTNWAAGMSPNKLDHQEVLQTGKTAAEEFARLLGVAL